MRDPDALRKPGASIVRPMRPQPIWAMCRLLLGADAPSTEAGIMDGNASDAPEAAALRMKLRLLDFMMLFHSI